MLDISDALQRHVGEPLAGRSLAVYLPDLSGGGAERLHIGLAPYFQREGLSVTLLLNKARGDLLKSVSAPIASLDTDRQLTGLPRLVNYLKQARPDFLIANMEHMNVTAVLANKIAGSRTHVFASQHNTLSKQAGRSGLKHRTLPWLYRLAMPYAAGIVAVSKGVGDDLSATAGIPRDKISVIYNGVFADDFEARAAAPADFAWLDHPGSLLVAVGRMVAQKDFPTLLKAFATVAAQRPSTRLAILGEGPLRNELEQLAATLGVADRIVMPGFVQNSLAVMSRARLVVMSSQFEGFGLVLAEALACGTPVVSTDCPYGPAEILADGAFGALTAVGDPQALAQAILEALDRPVDRERLKARGREFSLAHCAEQYLDLFRDALRRDRNAVTAGGSS